MDTLVFDIETQNFFTDPGVGWNNYDALKISVVGLYSYAKDRYFCFEESALEEAGKWFRDADRLVGFSMNRYDVPVLQRYFRALPDREGLDLWSKERVDLLSEIEAATGSRVSLERLAQANLGVGKSGRGAKAIELFREGNMEELKRYCLLDVELTKKLYDLYEAKGELIVPSKGSGEPVVVHLKGGVAQREIS